MNESPPKRGRGAPKGNKNALKHALYARHYDEKTKHTLTNWDVKDYIGEAQLIRVSIDKVAEILLSDDTLPMEKTAMLNALSQASRTVAALIKHHLLLNTDDDPIYVAWLDTTYEKQFFPSGSPLE